MRSRSAILFAMLAALTLFLFLLDLAVGAVAVPLGDVWAALTGGDCPRATAKIILNIRLIKAVVALLAGAALSVSGLQMQTLFRNPLAGPYVLGISSGASLGVALVVLAGFGSSIGIAGASRYNRREKSADRHCRGGLARSGARAGRHRRRRPPHQGHHGDSDSRHDVLVGSRRDCTDIAISQQGRIPESLCHLDDGVARRRDLRPACGTRPVDYRRTVVGGGDDQAAQLTAVRRGVCRDDGAEHPTLARAAVPLHDAACWYGDRLLRSDRLHRTGHAPRHENAVPQQRPSGTRTGNRSFGCGGAASLRPRF